MRPDHTFQSQQAARRAQIQKLRSKDRVQKRDMMGLTQLDETATDALRNDKVLKDDCLDDADKRRLAKVVTGSFRSVSCMYEVQKLPPHICPLCGTGWEATKEQYFWRCPRWLHHRAEAKSLQWKCDFRFDDELGHRGGTPALWRSGLCNEDTRVADAKKLIPGERAAVVPGALRAGADKRNEVWEDDGGTPRLLVSTDGSAICPTDARFCRAGFRVFFGPYHSWNRSAPLVGYHQVVPPAELRAVLEAMRISPLPTRIPVDCNYAVDGYEALVNGASYADRDHYDLWEETVLEIRSGGCTRAQVVKAKDHTTLKDVADGVAS